MRATPRSARQQDAFLYFYDATFTEAYRYAGRLCGGDRSAAEDLVQEAYVAVLRQFRTDSSRELRIGYVITTIRNRHLDHLRSAAREQQRMRLVATDTGERELALVPSELAGLPERERTALVLRYVDDLAVPEVAKGC